MKYLDGNYYVEVKDHRYKIHPNEIIFLRKRHPPTSLRTQYQVQNDTQIRKKHKVIKNDNDQLVVKNYPKNKQPIFQKQNFKPPNCPSCKQNIWSEFDKSYYCKNCDKNLLSTNKNTKLIKKFVDRVTIFQLDYIMPIKRSEKFGLMWLILNIIQQKVWLINYKN